jgi:uncharacterized membrane protein
MVIGQFNLRRYLAGHLRNSMGSSSPPRPSPVISLLFSGLLAFGTAASLHHLRPNLRARPEKMPLGGFVAAILFFFLLIFVGNVFQLMNRSVRLGWITIGLCEAAALVASFSIHPVCATMCVIFSIPVIIYVKWAATKIHSAAAPNVSLCK